MANSYKNIVITPNVGSSTDDPKIVFSGANTSTNTDITLRVYPTLGGTLSVEGGAGQLFSVSNTLTGSIFSVNDVSGIPSIEVLDTGLVKMAQYGGNVEIGSATSNSSLIINSTVAATSNTTGALQVDGGVGILGNVNTVGTVTLSGAAPFILYSNTISANVTIPTGYNTMLPGNVTIATGSSVTVNTGSRFVII